jgi:Peptidase family M50
MGISLERPKNWVEFSLDLVHDDSLLLPAITIFAVVFGAVAWPFIAIFLHELGHATAAKLVGVAPVRLIIGLPDESEPLFSFRCFGCSVECWPIPFGGATLFTTLPRARLKIFILTIGGPVIDLFVIFLCCLLWHYSFLRLGLAFIILSQTINILRNLIPVSSLYAGICVPSDGKVILQLFARRHQI